MPAVLDARRLARALALLALACGTGTITGPGGSTGPPDPENHPPEITVAPAPTATPILEGGSTLLSVTADDPDGDNLSYAWTQTAPASPQGSFSSRTLRNPVWTAPAVAQDTVFTFQVSVNDGEGGSASPTCQVTVTHLTVNRSPNVSASITVSPAMPVAGEPVTLSITANDPDGDPLTIAWEQTAPSQQGTFGSTSTASTTWISPPLGVASPSTSIPFSFQVSVSDGHNPPVVRQVTLTVTMPSYANDIRAIWNSKCMPCHDATHADGQLDLTAAVNVALLNVAMVHSCSNTTRVIANQPNSSGLMDKLRGTSCGTRMPEGSNPLSAGELVMIESWILAGALDN
jgi:hypothetical protein